MNTLRYVDYKNKKELTLSFFTFAEAKQSALAFSKFINPDGNTKRPNSVDGVIDHANIYSDLYEDFAVMLNVPTSKKSEPESMVPESEPMPNFNGISKLEFDNIEVKMVHHKEVRTPSLFEIPKRPTKGIAVDVGCKGNPGKAEYRGVDLETGEVVFHVQIPGLASNNIGEYLGAVDGLAHALGKADKDYKVYSDSMTAIAWVKHMKCKTKLIIENEELQRVIKQSEHWLRTYGGKVWFWNNKIWGEIPADLSGTKGVARYPQGHCQRCGVPTFGKYCANCK